MRNSPCESIFYTNQSPCESPHAIHMRRGERVERFVAPHITDSRSPTRKGRKGGGGGGGSGTWGKDGSGPLGYGIQRPDTGIKKRWACLLLDYFLGKRSMVGAKGGLGITALLGINVTLQLT
jgi:hypothetical protein